jgi:hypothetical protein
MQMLLAAAALQRLQMNDWLANMRVVWLLRCSVSQESISPAVVAVSACLLQCVLLQGPC